MSRIELIHGSCADQNVDAVVNAANRYLAAGGGICGAIFKKAGHDELSAACSKCKTPVKDGGAVITPAFGISNAKHIIHAVGPNFNEHPLSALQETISLLQDAYYNSLTVLKENDLHSISFPLISSGIFAGGLKDPAMVSATQCLKAYRKFTEEYPEYDLHVKLCAFSDREMEQCSRAFERTDS